MHTVSEQTYQRRLNQLINDVSNHTNKSELLMLMEEQVIDDSHPLDTPYTCGQYSLMDGVKGYQR